jgi:hypothetical protein
MVTTMATAPTPTSAIDRPAKSSAVSETEADPTVTLLRPVVSVIAQELFDQ